MFFPVDEFLAKVALPIRLRWPDSRRAELLILSHHNLAIRGVQLDGPAVLHSQMYTVIAMFSLLGVCAVANATCPLLFDVVLLCAAIELLGLAGVAHCLVVRSPVALVAAKYEFPELWSRVPNHALRDVAICNAVIAAAFPTNRAALLYPV